MHLTERDLYQGYGVTLRPSRAAERIARAFTTEARLLARIRELIAFRRWYRQQVRQDYWMDLATRNDQELRALVTLARQARRDIIATPEPDGWTEAELREAFGGR